MGATLFPRIFCHRDTVTEKTVTPVRSREVFLKQLFQWEWRSVPLSSAAVGCLLALWELVVERFDWWGIFFTPLHIPCIIYLGLHAVTRWGTRLPSSHSPETWSLTSPPLKQWWGTHAHPISLPPSLPLVATPQCEANAIRQLPVWTPLMTHKHTHTHSTHLLLFSEDVIYLSASVEMEAFKSWATLYRN